jgi:glycyl-tRNA synthetase beta chain
MTETRDMQNGGADLLIELGCEELPPKALDRIRQAFFNEVCDGLESSNIDFDRESSRAYSSPRRLALYLESVASQQPDQDLERRGPALSAAFDAEGNPTGAALGFARSVGKEVAELETVETDKGAWLFARVHQAGKPLSELIFSTLEQAVRKLPVPKPMRWADHDFSFVRPVHWLVVLHGDQVLGGQLLGQTSGRSTRGHRIHAPGPHQLSSSEEYVELLRSSYVLVDPEERRTHIERASRELEASVLIEPALLDEVNNLVEWPVAVACSFDEEFLAVPHTALIASMQDHQKFFPVRDDTDTDRVTNRFVAISNIESTQTEAVRAGYERVIRPRLADARFFLEQDQKQSLEAYHGMLSRVVYQNKIGTVGDKSRRMSVISEKLADFFSEDPELASRAAGLCKCDLMTQMVGEFPELQGEMGRHYALASGEAPEVAAAIGEHYAPRFAGDAIPSTGIGRLVSIADRLDSLVGIFAAGLKPSGNRDPFALRRAALGLVRILIEAELDQDLDILLKLAAKQLAGQIDIDPALVQEVRGFIVERLRHYYHEQGFSTELINAALASEWATLPDLNRRIHALSGFMGQKAAQSLAASNKRIGNILRKAGETKLGKIKEDRLVLSQEKMLFDEVIASEKIVQPLFSQGRYEEGLRNLAELKGSVDAFFDKVMVMDENPELRNNRLSLLARLKGLFDQVADLSILG